MENLDLKMTFKIYFQNLDPNFISKLKLKT